MPNSNLRQRVQNSGGRRSRPSPRWRGPSKQPKHIEILKRCSSEPSLCSFSDGDGDVAYQKPMRIAHQREGILYRPQTCLDVFAMSLSSMAFSPQNNFKVSHIVSFSSSLLNVVYLYVLTKILLKKGKNISILIA